MTTIVTTHIIDNKPVKTEHEIDTNPGGFTLIVHQQGLKVDVPNFVEVDAQDTIRCMDEMSQQAWEWICTGPMFKLLWGKAFADYKEEQSLDIPTSIEVLNMGDLGIRHTAGLIVLGCEACVAGKSVFFRNPETYLHPKVERCIATMLHKMLELFDKSGEVKVKVKGYTKKDGTKVEGYERTKKPAPSDPDEDLAQCLEWLQKLQDHYGPEKEIVDTQSDEGRLTVGQLIEEVTQNTCRGQWFVKEYVKSRDGG